MAEETVQITAVLKDRFSRNVNTINSSISGLQKNLRNLQKELGPLASRFTAFGAALAGVGLSGLAADAEETQSKFNAVFKDLSDTTETFVNDLASSVGRGRTELRGFLATLQDTFVPLGFARAEAAELSKQLVTLAIDVASFNNEADAAVIRAFQSALVGNTEAVRRYGIVLSQARLEQEALAQGFENGLAGLTESEKAQLRLNVILQATADAQGDALRTQDSFQNSLKRTNAVLIELGEELGAILNDELKPFLIAVAETANELLAWVRANQATIQAVIQLATQLALALLALKGFLILKALIPIFSSFGNVLAAIVVNLKNTVISMASLARGGASTAAAIQRNSVALRRYNRGLQQLGRALKSVGIGIFLAALTDTILAFKTIENAVGNARKALDDTSRSFADIQGDIEASRKELEDLSAVDLDSVTGALGTFYRIITNQAQTAARELQKLNNEVELQAELQAQTVRQTVGLINTYKNLAESTSKTAEEQRSLRDAAAAMNAILAQQGDIAKNARTALNAGAGELIDLYEKQVITLNQLIGLSEQRTEAVEGTVKAFIEENKQADELKNNAEIINKLFSEISDDFFKQGPDSSVFKQLSELKIEGNTAVALDRLGAALDQIRENGTTALSTFIQLQDQSSDLQEKVNILTATLVDNARTDFVTGRVEQVQRSIDAIEQETTAIELQIEKRRLLGEISDEDANEEQQQLRINQLVQENRLIEQQLAIQRQLVTNTSALTLQGSTARANAQEEVNRLLERQLDISNQLKNERAQIVNEDLAAANAARDAFIARAEGLEEFVAQQQQAIDNGQTTFEKAQDAIIAKQEELNASFEQTTEKINTIFGEGTDLAEEYNAQLLVVKGTTEELGVTSENAFTTLDRVLQQTTGTLVNSLTNSMAGFFEEIITGSKDGKQAFGDLLRNMAQNFAQFAAQTIAKLLIIRAISAFIPGGFAAQSVGIGLNNGGMVPGSGPDRDSVPAHLTPGEYVIPRKRVQQYGAGVMNALRAGSIPVSALRQFSSAKGTIKTNNLQSGGQATDTSIGTTQSGEGLVLPIMQANDNNAETILNGGETAFMRWFMRNNTQVKSILDSSES